MLRQTVHHKIFNLLVFFGLLLCPFHHDMKEMQFEQEVISHSVKQVKSYNSSIDLHAKAIKNPSLKKNIFYNSLLKSVSVNLLTLSLLATSSTVLLL